MNKLTLTIAALIFSHAAWCDSFMLSNDQSQTTVTTEDLMKLPCEKIVTSTNFTPSAEFSGVSLESFIKKYAIKGSAIRVFALDDYSYTIPLSELTAYHAIIAYKKNGNFMPISDLGPYSIIYPRDRHPELNKLDVDAKTVWQIRQIDVLK